MSAARMQLAMGIRNSACMGRGRSESYRYIFTVHKFTAVQFVSGQLFAAQLRGADKALAGQAVCGRGVRKARNPEGTRAAQTATASMAAMDTELSTFALKSELKLHESDVKAVCGLADGGIGSASRDRAVAVWSPAVDGERPPLRPTSQQTHEHFANSICQVRPPPVFVLPA
eukprot:SAG22_NODE_35_length_27276_cov_20.395849_8_plen_172_part_00